MRPYLVVMALLALVSVTNAAAQSPEAAPAVEPQYQILHTPDVAPDPVARSADEVLKEERRRLARASKAPVVATAPSPATQPAPATIQLQTLRPVIAPDIKTQTFLAEDRHRALLQGRAGPFVQATTAWNDRDWFSLIWAVATLGVWLLGSGFVIWLGFSAVQAFNRH